MLHKPILCSLFGCSSFIQLRQYRGHWTPPQVIIRIPVGGALRIYIIKKEWISWTSLKVRTSVLPKTMSRE